MRRVPHTWLLGGILAVAALTRLAWALAATRDPVGEPDPAFYLGAAGAIADGDGYLRDGAATAHLPPGYPFALAAVLWVVRHTPLPDDGPAAGAALNLVLGVASVALVYALGRRLFDPGVGLVAAAIAAVFPGPVFFTGALLSETLFTFLVLAALVVVAREPWTPWRLAAFGAVAGVAALTRPAALVLIVALAVAGLAARAGPRVALTQAGIALAACALVIAPWTIRNAIRLDAFVPISSNGGEDLCIGHNPRANGAFQTNRHCQPPGLSEVGADREAARAGWRFVRDHPEKEPRLLALKARRTYLDDQGGLDAVESYGLDPFLSSGARAALSALADGFYFVVVLLGLLGLRALAVREPRRLLVLLTLAGFAVLPLVFFGDPRFHEPMLPLLTIAAAVTIMGLARRRAPAN